MRLLLLKLFCIVVFVAQIFCVNAQHKSKKKNTKVSIRKDVSQPVVANNTLLQLLNDTVISNAHIGIYIQEDASKNVIANYQSNKFFLPASCTKIATCFAALKYLGDSVVGAKYFVANDSTINILATGDPSFLHPKFFNQVVYDTLKKYKFINIHQTQNKFNPLGDGWSWNDYEEAYMAERSAMPVFGNVVSIGLDVDSLQVVPNAFAKFVKLNSSKEPIINHRNLNSNNIEVSKKEIDKKPLQLSYTTNINPSVVDILKDVLPNAVITLKENAVAGVFNKSIYSVHIDSILKPMMQQSDNFLAEQTLLMTSFKQLNYLSDKDVIEYHLKNIYKDLPQKPRWVDGSGLSRYNLFTPQDLVFILSKMKKDIDWKRVSNIFPTGGQGTLKNFYQKYQNKIFAKTGSMGNTFCISGYLITNNNKHVNFSVMVNSFNNASGNYIRTQIEKYLTSVIEEN